MGRRPNPQRKVELLDEIVEYLLVNGLNDLSLRPLATALGTSTYTLTYQFGSKEAMVAEAVAHFDAMLNERHSADDDPTDTPAIVLTRLWALATDEDGRRWSQVMLEISTMTSRQPILFESFEPTALHGRIEHLAAAHERASTAGDSRELATSQISTVHGLIVDLLLTGDVERTSSVFSTLVPGCNSEPVPC